MITIEADMESIAPYSQSRAFQTPKNTGEGHDAYDLRVWRERMHVTDEGYVFIPPMGIKNCIADVAKFLSESVPGKGKAIRYGIAVGKEGFEWHGVANVTNRRPWPTWTPPPEMIDRKPNGNKEISLNFITPHQKWGIHSTYTHNLMMLTLNRGGPVIWLSEDDAKSAGIVDNDWVELFNTNGAIAIHDNNDWSATDIVDELRTTVLAR